MIPQAAIDDYLDRELDNHLWIKKLSKQQLWDAVNALKPRPRLSPKMFKHQLACFLLGVSYPQFSFWVDMGGGKTYVSLALLEYWHLCGRLRRAVIFVKSNKAFPTWEAQIKRWDIRLPYVVLEGSSVEKWQQHAELEHGLILVARPGAVAMTSKVMRVKKGKKKGKKRWKLNDDLIARFAEDVDALVMDESTCEGHDSLNHNLIKKMQKTVSIRYALAGRPFGRDPTMLWMQQYLIDKGESFGETLGLFRGAFFSSEPHPYARNDYVKKHTFKKRMQPTLARMLQHRSITYGEGECTDLPKLVPIIEEVKFPEEAGEYYKRAVKSIIEAKGNYQEVQNVFLRMRQLSSGFVGFKDDETGERVQVEFDDNPKFDRLMELTEEMPMNRKGVVFYEFTYSGRKIAEGAKERGLKPIWLWSGAKDYKKQLQRFQDDPDTALAVINNRIGAYSLDGLQDVANYCFFYESPVSGIDREQAERRLRREGQRYRVFQYDIIVKGSADAKILAFHKEANDLLKSVLRNPALLAEGLDG